MNPSLSPAKSHGDSDGQTVSGIMTHLAVTAPNMDSRYDAPGHLMLINLAKSSQIISLAP